jgi:hypothetical protein
MVAFSKPKRKFRLKTSGQGKRVFEKEFISKGKAQAPAELKEIDKLAKQYADTYNAQRPNGTSELRAHPAVCMRV